MRTETIKKKIIAELSDEKYKLTIKTEKPIKEIDPADYTDEINAIFGGIEKSTLYFRMAVWDNGSTDFNDHPAYSQGNICYYQNNTDFIYIIAVNTKTLECRLAGYRRPNYGGMSPAWIQKTPYAFKIKSASTKKTKTTNKPIKTDINASIHALGFPKENYKKKDLENLTDKQRYEYALSDPEVCIIESLTEFQDTVLNCPLKEFVGGNWWYFVTME